MKDIQIHISSDPRRIDREGPILVAHQPECMPWLGNISKACMGDVYFILDSVQFVKKHWQNKNKIRINGGDNFQWLTIPVHGVQDHRLITTDVRIAKGNWKQKHLKTLELTYRKAPFFEEIFKDLQIIYSSESELLIDFLLEFIYYAFNKFEIEVPIYRTSELIKQGYIIEGEKSNLIISMCKVVNAKVYVFGCDGRTYIDKEVFCNNKVKFVFQDYTHPVYNQIQGNFVSHMSFLDLLFNYGPKSIEVLGKSNYLEE
jgi:hypothetical protein